MLRRLRTLEALDRVGAGDLLGEAQAGHVALVGVDLFHHLLGRALRLTRGESVAEEWTSRLSADVAAFIPDDYVAEEALRVELHARLAAAAGRGDARDAEDRLDVLGAEIADRFGPFPGPVSNPSPWPRCGSAAAGWASPS